MSISIITTAWDYFHNIDNEDFTGKIRQAISMSNLIKDFNKTDLIRLKWLRDNTNKNIKRPIYELDRYVDSTKGVINNKSFTFPSGNFTQDKIQYYLCLAIEEVSEIIYRNFKDFKVESKLGLDDDQESGSDDEW